MNKSNLIRCAAAALAAAAWLPSQSAPAAASRSPVAAEQSPAPTASKARVQARLSEVIKLLAQDDLSAEERADARKKLEEIAAQLRQQQSPAPSAVSRPRRMSMSDGQQDEEGGAPVAARAPKAPKPPKPPEAGVEVVAPEPAEAPAAPRARRPRTSVAQVVEGEPMVVEITPEGGEPLMLIHRRAADDRARKAHAEALEHAKVLEVTSPDGTLLRRERISEADEAKVRADAERAHAEASRAHADAMRAHERALLDAHKFEVEAQAQDGQVKALRAVVEGQRQQRGQATQPVRGRVSEVRGEGDDDAEIRQVIEEMRKEMREIRELMQQLREKAHDRATGMGGSSFGNSFGRRSGQGLGGDASAGPAAGGFGNSFGQRGAMGLGGGSANTGPAAGSLGPGMRMRGLGTGAASGSSDLGSGGRAN